MARSSPAALPCAALLALAAPPAAVQCPGRELSAELFAGSAWSLPTPLRVVLPGGSARLDARWRTRPLADSPYYSYRVGWTLADGRAVEGEMLHHKLYLANPRPPVERLEVTHGYNLPTVNLASASRGWRLRAGIGLVVAHPEGRIAGRPIGGVRTLLGGGYHIAGVTAQLAVGRRYALGRGRVALTAAPEAKLTASWASIPLGPGRLVVPNVALHALGGLGVRRCD